MTVSQDIITMTLQQGSSLKPSIQANQVPSHQSTIYPLLPSDLINELFSLIAVSGLRAANGQKGRRDEMKERKEGRRTGEKVQ